MKVQTFPFEAGTQSRAIIDVKIGVARHQACFEMSHQEIDMAPKLGKEDFALLTLCALTFSELSMCTGAPHAAVGFDSAKSQVSEWPPQESPHMFAGGYVLCLRSRSQLCICQNICVQCLLNDFCTSAALSLTNRSDCKMLLRSLTPPLRDLWSPLTRDPLSPLNLHSVCITMCCSCCTEVVPSW